MTSKPRPEYYPIESHTSYIPNYQFILHIFLIMSFYFSITVITLVISLLSHYSKQCVLPSQNQHSMRFMFILAHPDDEIMFMVNEIEW